MTSTGRSGGRWRRGLRGAASLGRSLAVGLVVSLVAWAATGCSLDSLLKSDQVPPNKTDPAITETPAGALAVYHGTIVQFRRAFGGSTDITAFVTAGGMLSDELRLGSHQGFQGAIDLIDARLLPEGVSRGPYAALQKVRGQAGQAIGLLTRYVPEAPALVGHNYALEGYAEVLLAELYCSGIPLSTLDFGGNYTLRPGSTTAEVFQHAAALFDTALALAGDSARFVDLAALGKARALLGLGDFAGAAAAVAAVPDGYHYDVSYSAAVTTNDDPRNFVWLGGQNVTQWAYSVTDYEGGNGLDYLSSGDPRSAGTLNVADNGYGFPIYWPAKYATDGSSPIVLASGVEARLIAAEAALQAGDASWLTTLNALRTDGTFDVDTQVVAIDNTVTPPDTTFAYDTLWHAGTGGMAGLAPLADPGTADGRVDLLFRERALWLFLTGHRQGDLRRLIRQYGRQQEDVYPVGPYPGATAGQQYGSDVTLPIPPAESVSNPLFHGCFTRNA